MIVDLLAGFYVGQGEDGDRAREQARRTWALYGHKCTCSSSSTAPAHAGTPAARRIKHSLNVRGLLSMA